MLNDSESALDTDDVGSVGQDAFKLWCSQSKIAAMLATRDKFGWDYLLQWTEDRDLLEPPAVSCKVQVKTTGAGATAAGIKLSNWRLMALEPGPWFVVAISLRETQVDGVFLVPVDQELVAKTVAKLAEFEGTGTGLHTVRMNVSWGEQYRLAAPYPAALLDAIRKHVGSSEEAYRVKKSDWITLAKKAAEPTLEGTFSFDTATDAELADLLARFAVGLVDTLPIKDFTGVVKRFGKTVSGGEIVDATEVYMHCQDRSPDGSARVTMFDRERSEVVCLKFGVYSTTAMFAELPKSHHWFRLVSPLLSFLWKPVSGGSTFEVSLQLDGEKKMSLGHLDRVCRLVRMFANASTAGLFASIDLGTSVLPVMDLSTTPHAPFEPQVLDFASVAEGAAAIARYFALDTDAIEVTPAELMKRQFRIRMFADGIDRSMPKLDLRVGIPGGEENRGKRAALVVRAVVPLGPHVLVGLFSIVGTADWRQMEDGTGTMGVTGAEMGHHFKQIVPRAEWEKTQLVERERTLVAELERTGVEIVAMV